MKFKNLILTFGVMALGLSMASCRNADQNVTTTITPSETTVDTTTADTSTVDTTTADTSTVDTTTAEESTTVEPDKVIEREEVTLKCESDTLNVTKVSTLTDDFIMGMDVSSVLAEEASGVKYYDFDGNEEDLLKILAESGINYIRCRVWNDPYDEEGNGFGGGNCDINTAIEIGKRATKYGMKMLIDFHYSDFWADPGKQMIPRAWEGMSTEEKAEAIYEYTKDCLQKLKHEGIDVGMVQIGNETNGKFCGESDWEKMCLMFNGGAKAVREVLPDAQVALHFANPETNNRYISYASNLKTYNVDYDIFASSYYPYWHGTLTNLSQVLKQIGLIYGKKTMVAETSYCYTSEDTDFQGNTISDPSKVTSPYPFTVAGQANHIRELTNTLANTSKCIGLFYWEGAWITVGTTSWEENHAKWEKYGSGWASSYASAYDPDDAGKYYGGTAVDNQTFFDSTGHPLESLKVWGLMKTGNDAPVYADGVENAEMTVQDDAEITLPETVNVIYSDNKKRATAVTWDYTEADVEKWHNNGNAQYTINGVVDDLSVVLTLNVLSYNYVTDYSFEDGSSAWTTVLEPTGTGSSYNAGISKNNVNGRTGVYSNHFWASNANTVKYAFEQDVTGLETGTYCFIAFMMGGIASGTADSTQQNIYMYVKIDGEIVAQTAMNFTSYNDGWKSFQVRDVAYTEGQTFTIGIYCEANEAGSWGDFDDLMVNLQK